MVTINQTYTVVSGDTLYGISNQYGVSVSELINLNNVDPNKLQIGQVLKIPVTSGVNPNNTIIYTVKRGDTLYSLAQKYGTSVDQIIKLNNLKSNTLQIGQQLKIPETYNIDEQVSLPDYISYTVKKGDNIYSIARLNNIDVDTIIKDNSLSSDNLSIGQVLKIRVSPDTLIEECYGTDYTPPSSSSITYVVKRGDNLYSISNKYGVSVSDIVKLNNLKNNTLQIGQQLKIPSTNNVVTYIVKKGDNLYSIARRYNTTVDSIKKKNNLKSNLLSIGQKLII